jgi:hypothetical protein
MHGVNVEHPVAVMHWEAGAEAHRTCTSPFLRFKLKFSNRIKAFEFFLKKSLFHMHGVHRRDTYSRS